MDEVEELVKARQAAEEMLGFVLLAVGEPVVVTKEMLKAGIPDGAEITINEDVVGNAFVFGVSVPNEQQ